MIRRIPPSWGESKLPRHGNAFALCRCRCRPRSSHSQARCWSKRSEFSDGNAEYLLRVSNRYLSVCHPNAACVHWGWPQWGGSHRSFGKSATQISVAVRRTRREAPGVDGYFLQKNNHLHRFIGSLTWLFRYPLDLCVVQRIAHIAP